jgi:dihydroorotate dehydrogenase (NAD+) catalytic subunit
VGPSLVTDLGDRLRLPTPVLAASGCFNTGKEARDLVDLRRIGGVVSKSVTLNPRRGLPIPRMAETASGMLNAIGLQNVGVDEFVAKEGPYIETSEAPVIVSIAGRSVDEYVHVMLRVRDLPGVVAVEANLSSPNLDRGNRVFACHPDQAAQVIGAISRFTATPVFAKLAADVTNIVEVAEACVSAGAYGLSLINTLLAMAIDVHTYRPKLGAITGGLSGPAIKPVAVRCVWQVARALPDVPIMGMGGIVTAEDAIEFLLAGAWAVQVGTTNFVNPEAPVQIAEGIRDFLAARGLSSPADLRGRVEIEPGVAEPAHSGG